MKTKTVGEILSHEREMHRLSLADLSKKIRVKADYLQALENNQFDKLPAATFVKGYIKSYARLFAFNSQPLLALLRRDYKESAKGRLVPRDFVKPVLKRQKFFKPVTLVLILLASVFVSLASYVGWQWYNLNKPPKLVINSPKEEAFVAPQVLIEGETTPETVVLINSSPIQVAADGSFSVETYLPREGITTITIEATDRRGKTSLVQRTVYVKF